MSVATAATLDFFVATLAFVCDIVPIVQHYHPAVAVVLMVAVVAEGVVVAVGIAEVAVVVLGY